MSIHQYSQRDTNNNYFRQCYNKEQATKVSVTLIRKDGYTYQEDKLHIEMSVRGVKAEGMIPSSEPLHVIFPDAGPFIRWNLGRGKTSISPIHPTRVNLDSFFWDTVS